MVTVAGAHERVGLLGDDAPTLRGDERMHLFEGGPRTHEEHAEERDSAIAERRNRPGERLGGSPADAEDGAADHQAGVRVEVTDLLRVHFAKIDQERPLFEKRTHPRHDSTAKPVGVVEKEEQSERFERHARSR